MSYRETIHPDFKQFVKECKKYYKDTYNQKVTNKFITKCIAERFDKADLDVFKTLHSKKGKKGLKAWYFTSIQR